VGIPLNIGSLLEQHCEATQLYLQHDLTLQQLATAIGTNRTYLSQYFAQQDITYNSYINSLRIKHFMRLYRDSITSLRPATATELAQQSGFRSYSTFAVAFKQFNGQTVTAWMKDQA
jgi:AraC-like DNA-binding protein